MHGNWIEHTTTTTGTGKLVLSAVAGMATAASQFATNEVLKYAILDADRKPIERGIGYLDASGDLVRAKPMAAMPSGVYDGADVAVVSLSAGIKYVICAPDAQGVIGSAPGIWQPTNGVRAYGDAHIVGSTSTMTLVANRVYAIPFVASADADVDALCFRVITPAAGSAAKVAIFSVGLDGLPGVMLAEGSVVDLSTDGRKNSSFARMRPPPRFFACLISNSNTATVMSVGNGVNASSAMGFNQLFLPVSYIHHEGAAGLVYPAIWTPVENISNASRPLIAARIAA